MSSARPVSKAATAEPLLGAHVRLHSTGATAVVIGYSPERDRVLVRREDTGEVTRCVRAQLVLVR